MVLVRGHDRSHRGMRVSYAARCEQYAPAHRSRSSAPRAQAKCFRSSGEPLTVRIHGRDRSNGEDEMVRLGQLKTVGVIVEGTVMPRDGGQGRSLARRSFPCGSGLDREWPRRHPAIIISRSAR